MPTADERVPGVRPGDTASSKRNVWLTIDQTHDGKMPFPDPDRLPDLTPLSAMRLGDCAEVRWRTGGVDSMGIGDRSAAPDPHGVPSPYPGLWLHPNALASRPGKGPFALNDLTGDQGGGGVRAASIEAAIPTTSADGPQSKPRSSWLSRQPPAWPGL